MAHKIYGQITDTNSQNSSIAGLRIQAWDDDWPGGDDFMGEDISHTNGQYEIFYPDVIWDPQGLGINTSFPDIFITADIRNSSKKWVRVGKSQVYKNHNLDVDLNIDLGINIEDPISAQTDFKPKQNGFHFVNRFDVEPNILGVDVGKWVMGFCGGMSAGALWRFTNGLNVPPGANIPAQGTSLFDELLKRQIKSMPLELLTKLYDWQSAPDVSQTWRKTSIGQRTKNEWPQIKTELDHNRPVVLVLVRTKGYLSNPTLNHQVLATGYHYNPTTQDLTIDKYDPNCPDVTHTLYANLGLPDGKLYAKDSTGDNLRGFFINPAGKAASETLE